jgi:hypothetical protein
LGQVRVEANGPRKRKEVGWAGWLDLGWGFGFGFLFYFFFSSIPNFKQCLNSNTNLNSNHTQLKVCTSMNATQKFKPMIKF